MAGILEQSKEIRRIWSAFQSSRVLITANNFRVFDHLEDPKTSRQMARALRTDERATEILLDALAGIKLLRKREKRYCNSGIASKFLVSGRPYYQGDIISHAESLWDSWANLGNVLKTGRPSRMSRNHGAFILGMHNLAALKATAVVDKIDLRGINKALDLGGGPGTYSIEMVARGVHVTLFDTPGTLKIARGVINRSGVNKKSIDLMEGDFLRDDIGSGYDLVFMSQIIHSYQEEDNIGLLKKCGKALNRGGRVVIQEFLVSEDRTRPFNSALFAVNMLVNTEGGRTYSPEEMKKWLMRTGYKNVRRKAVTDGVLVTAVVKHR